MILADEKLTKGQVKRIEELSRFYQCERGESEIFNLIVDAKLLQPISEKEVPLRNYAIAKLTELGFNQEDKIREVIDWMLKHPVLDAKGKTGESNGND